MLTLLVRSSNPPPNWFWYIWVGLAALIVIIFLLKKRHERRRSKALATAAAQHGLSFEPEGNPLGDTGVLTLHLFTLGHSHRSRNIMRGSSGGLEVVVFDYQYVTGAGRSQSNHKQTVAAFRFRGANLLGFELRHESMFDKLASALGYQDVDFSDHPEFSRQYLLRGPDENGLRALFSPAVIDFFEQLAAGDKRWALEGERDLLLVYRPEKRVPPEELPQFLQDTTTIASQFRQATVARFGR